ncbi:MAG: B12-binding domain-containing radical SAM protein [Candidatus Altiarchaeales archaeon WOR_SM1_86-2]|nr:MAG: B12-binding domain-containing radical SAM protein [Candidatus Altiarchaeales archaeon WOR_SM1_86-2]
MKITLISPYPDITAFGLRTISAYLKMYGHKTQMIFLPDPYSDDLIDGVQRYKDHVLNELIPLCKESDLIGITLMTNFFDGAIQITRKLKSTSNIPIIWGGVHPTVRPEESLEYADMVCIGDGEEAILELSNKIESGENYSDTKNVWIKSDGEIIRNVLRPLTKNLDILPAPDYTLDDHHILLDGHIRSLTPERMKFFLERGTVSAYLNKIGYQTMTGRGCPHKCAYCINDTIKNLYHGQGYLRWRSTVHVIEELLWVKEKMPYIGYIWISDDAFFGRPLKGIKEFCSEYKKYIQLPFSVLASPLTVTGEKMELLIDAGLVYVQMGIETGSSKIQELFNRKTMSNEKMMSAIKIINKYKATMAPPSYDFILDVPYETDDDKIESLRFISHIPKPYHLQPFSLVLYPGTRLYEMAKEDGFIEDERRQIYSKSYTMREPSYLNFLITLAKGGRFPSPLLKFLVSAPAVKVFNSKPMKPLFRYLFIYLKGGYHLLKHLLNKR